MQDRFPSTYSPEYPVTNTRISQEFVQADCNLETSGADSSVFTEAVPETQAAMTVRPLGTACRCVGVVIGL